MENTELLTKLFDKKKITILKKLLENPKRQFYLQELSKETGVSMATCSRILNKLTKLELVEIVQVSRFKLYQMAQNPRVHYISTFVKEDVQIMKIFIEKAKDIYGILSIVMHGEEKADKANLLLIGNDIEIGKVKELCVFIKEKYGFTVTTLTVTEEQYRAMSRMGLYSGVKHVLWEK